MALLINLKNEIGLSTSYHRITRVLADTPNVLVVTIASYANESYRELEQKNEEVIAEYNKNARLLGEEYAKKEEERNPELISELSKKLGEENIPQDVSYKADEHTYSFQFDKASELSFSSIYEKLKALPQFEGAEDV